LQGVGWQQKFWDTVACVYDGQTAGLSTAVLTSPVFGTVFDQTDRVFAGWPHSLTAGLTTRAREGMWGDAATRNHQGIAFLAGKVVGFVHSILMGNVCAAGASAQVVIRALSFAKAYGNYLNARDLWQQGKYLEAAEAWMAVHGDIAQG